MISDLMLNKEPFYTKSLILLSTQSVKSVTHMIEFRMIAVMKPKLKLVCYNRR